MEELILANESNFFFSFHNFTKLKVATMEYNQLIERNPEVMLGKPIIKGTRITVELVVRKLAGGFSIEDLLLAYPHLTKEQIQLALQYSSAAQKS